MLGTALFEILFTNTYKQQEATHAKVIRETLINGGIAPFPNCTFRFNFTSPRNFIALGNMVST